MATMRAVRLHSYGGPDVLVLEEVDRPQVGAQLTQIAALIDAGKLKPAVTTTLPLAEAAKAHELSETGHVRGKIVQVGG